MKRFYEVQKKSSLKRWMPAVSVCIALVFVSQLSAFGAETLRIGTYPIPMLVEDSTHGLFIDLTNAIAEKAGLDIEIRVVPSKRIVLEFQQQQIDVLLPGLDVFFSADNQPIKSEPVAVKKDYIFTRKGTALLSSINDLEGKVVGITRGYPYSPELLENAAITFDEATTDAQSAKKLIAGRVEAFVVEETTGLQAFEQIGGVDDVLYDPEAPIATIYAYYAFHPTEQGRQLEQIFSDIIRHMKEDGTFEQIMSPASKISPD